MSVEAWCRHSDAPGPIVVQISELISQHLDVVGSKVGLISNKDIVSGRDCSLIHELRYEKEVRADVNLRNSGIDDGAGSRISGRDWRGENNSDEFIN